MTRVIPPHLDILLGRIESIGKRTRALVKNDIGDCDQDYWLADVVGELTALNCAIEEVRREIAREPSE